MNDDFFCSSDCIPIEIRDAEVSIYPSLFSRDESDGFYQRLQTEIDWQQEKIRLCGRVHDVPRLSAWYGDPDKVYTYSGIRSESLAWTPSLLIIKAKIEAVSSESFNSVLVNLYRSGADSVSWHSDDEPELGENPVIASVSFGQSRTFQMKHKSRPGEKKNIELKHGSFLLMKGGTQHHWLHQIPKSKKPMQARINLTFRQIN